MAGLAILVRPDILLLPLGLSALIFSADKRVKSLKVKLC
jgi:hypothetical protein